MRKIIFLSITLLGLLGVGALQVGVTLFPDTDPESPPPQKTFVTATKQSVEISQASVANDAGEKELEAATPTATLTATISTEFHDFFPLIGFHTSVDCETCHVANNYADLPPNCENCHSDRVPTQHYGTTCATCHTPLGWQETIFEHTLATTTNCSVCHAAVRPAKHYGNECSNCHVAGTSWQGAALSHEGLTDCQTCHAGNKPGNHFGGQCSDCHTAGAGWQGASFSHAGLNDCQACHAGNQPSNQYGGQCSE